MIEKIGIFLSILFLGISTSCSDFLQKDPPGSPSQSIFWKHKSDFISALAAVYSINYNAYLSVKIPNLDNLTDNGIPSESNFEQLILGDITPYSGGISKGLYKTCFTGIARVHIILKELANYTGNELTEADMIRFIAECKALRGYFYSWLYMCYREVPLVTEALDLDNMYREKAPREAIFKQIMQDFDDAIAGLPDKLYTDPEEAGHITVAAIKGLKARLLLHNAYDELGNPSDTSKLEEVISVLESIKGYSLSSTVRDNFLVDKQKTSPEIMFSINFCRPNIIHNMCQLYGSWTEVTITRELLNSFECIDGLKWGESPLTIPVNEQLVKKEGTDAEVVAERSKLFKNRDPRLAQTVTHSGYLIFPEKTFNMPPYASTTHYPQTNYSFMKYVQPTKSQPGYATISDQNVVIIRYAEVLMMLAEAENELNGPTQKVYDAVNAIRNRSDMPNLPTGLTKEEMRERIRHEWRIEFVGEGLRYFQLKRWKLMEKLVDGAVDPAFPSFKKVFKPAFYYWPIPQSEIDKAHGILTQDPYYV